MAPKKKTENSEAGENGGGKFTWEGANDNKLLLLTQGRYVKPEEYEQLASAFTGVTVGGIRNRISMLRVKQRDLYETLNWDLPSGGAGYSTKKPSTKKAKGGKRDAEAFDDVDDDNIIPETPSKKPKTTTRKMGEKVPPKPRVKKPKVQVKEEPVLDEDGDEEMEGLGADGEAHGKGEDADSEDDEDDGGQGQEDEC